MKTNRKLRTKPTERSFTLVETVLALALMVFLIVHFAGVQGNALAANEYARKMAQATWLAKRILAQVEYYAETKDWKTFATSKEKEKPFEDFPEYAYSISIDDWKVPLLNFLSGGLTKSEDEDSSKEKSGTSPFEGMMKQVLGDDLIKVAHVEISWPDGAQRSSISYSYILMNQGKIDEVVGSLKAVADAANPSPSPSGSPPSGSPAQPGGTPSPTRTPATTF